MTYFNYLFFFIFKLKPEIIKVQFKRLKTHMLKTG